MKFFRQKSADQKRLSVFSNKTNKGSIDQIVKKLRTALSENIALDEINNVSNTEISDNNIKLYLEILKYNISDRVDESRNSGNDATDIISFTDELFSSDILFKIIDNLGKVEFESKKIISGIIRNALLLQIDDRFVTVEYISKEVKILFALIDSYKYGRSDITLNCGRILRNCIHHECLARIILESENFDQFFQFVNQTTFDVAMDALLTFRKLLTTHPTLTAEYFSLNFNHFFSNYKKLIKSDNYVVKRQSLEIFGLLLSEKLNAKVRQQFILDKELVKYVMNLFWHNYKHIRFRALNIFNAVLNTTENKPIELIDFFISNKQKLVPILNQLKYQCIGSKVFTDQRIFVTNLLRDLN